MSQTTNARVFARAWPAGLRSSAAQKGSPGPHRMPGLGVVLPTEGLAVRPRCGYERFPPNPGRLLSCLTTRILISSAPNLIEHA